MFSQFWAAQICWRIYRELRRDGFGDMFGGGPGGDLFGGLDEPLNPGQPPGRDGQTEGQGRPSQTQYVAFAGEAHRL